MRLHLRSVSLVLCALTAACIIARDGAALTSSGPTFAAAVRAQFGVDLVVPFEHFDAASPRALLPGSTIARPDVDTFADKGRIVRLADATLCHVPGINYGSPQGSTSFRQTGSTDIKSDAREAKLLFGLDNESLASIKGYRLQLSRTRLFNIPFDRLNQFAAQTGADPKCAGASSNKAVISRSLIATVEVTITSHRPLPSDLLERIGKTLSPGSPVALQWDTGSAYSYSVTLPDRWIGVRTEPQF